MQFTIMFLSCTESEQRKSTDDDESQSILQSTNSGAGRINHLRKLNPDSSKKYFEERRVQSVKKVNVQSQFP